MDDRVQGCVSVVNDLLGSVERGVGERVGGWVGGHDRVGERSGQRVRSVWEGMRGGGGGEGVLGASINILPQHG